MDAKITLITVDQMVSEELYSGALDLLRGYFEWRLKGGFEPNFGSETIRGKSKGDQIANVLFALILDRMDA